MATGTNLGAPIFLHYTVILLEFSFLHRLQNQPVLILSGIDSFTAESRSTATSKLNVAPNCP